MRTYQTSELAKIVSIHPNTVRKYEQEKFLSEVQRSSNGYRIFEEHHLHELQFIRLTLQQGYVIGYLRKMAFEIIKTIALKDYNKILEMVEDYQHSIQEEIKQSQEAIYIVEKKLKKESASNLDVLSLSRKEVAARLGVTVEVLRSWERNNLFVVKQYIKNRPIYSSIDLEHLKIIRTLRNANYSTMAILKMLKKLEQETDSIDLEKQKDEDQIIYATDRLIQSLNELLDDSYQMKTVIEKLKK